MREEYDFTGGKKNPYSKKLKKQISINISIDVLETRGGRSERAVA